MAIYFYLLLGAAFLCLVRIAQGPTPPDRTVAIDILGTLIVGFFALYSVRTGEGFYMNVALVWALISFIGTMAVAKFLEGRGFDE